MTHSHTEIIDPITLEMIGHIDIVFNDEDYQKIISENNRIALQMSIFILLTTIIFVLLLRRQFKELKELTNYVLAYNPKSNSTPIKKSNRLDEVGIIHNAISSMVVRINAYAKMLDKSNIELETKVEQRTQELSQTNEQLADLLEEFKNFTANTIHQNRTPISIMKIAVEMIETKDKDALLQIKSSLLSMEHMYDTLAYTINQENIEFEKENINLSSLMQERINFFQIIALAHDTKIEYQIEPDLYIDMNRTEAEFLIDNNLSNALKYTTPQQTIYVNLIQSTSNIVLIFDSLGKRIEDPQRIFKRYTRSDTSKKGSGLGLNIVDTICKKNDITINLKYVDGYNRFEYTVN